MPVPPARVNSWEDILHDLEPADKLTILHRGDRDQIFNIPLGHRAIGVVYHADQDYFNNYAPSLIPARYDAFLFFDVTPDVTPA